MSHDPGAFLRAYEEVVPERLQGRYRGPASLLGAWEGFVEQCEEGYDFEVEEFNNDLSVRDFIQKICDHPLVQGDPVRDEFRDNVDRVDKRFRGLLQESTEVGVPGSSWWRRGVLKRAGRDYVDGVRGRYGIDVDVIED